MKGYGKVVVVKHASELSTVYAHNSKLLVRMGERVKQGQVIARVGQTGWATGPHLHFEVRRRGVPEDPMDFLPAP
jgi:murein DD-endopeptidase MepM/ murein hydrolase activator NlpD